MRKNILALVAVASVVVGPAALLVNAQTQERAQTQEPVQHLAQEPAHQHTAQPKPEVSTVKEEGNNVIAELNDYRADLPKNRLSGLVATVEVEKVQSIRNGGIKLVIAIVNKGEQDVDFHNPLDFMHVTISDEAGQVVKLPGVAHRFKLNTPGPNMNKIRLPFKFSVNLNGKPLDDEEINAAIMHLTKGSSYHIFIDVDKIVEEPKQSPAQDKPPQPLDAERALTVISIPAGEYQVRASVWLTDPMDIAIRRVLESPFIKVNLIEDKPAPQNAEKK